jgi:long-chain acyl-CoA synthetase
MTAFPGSLEHWAAAAPNAVAIVEDERTLTYSAWNDASNRVAQAFTAASLGEGEIVAVRTHIRLEWPIISAALAKLGCRLLAVNWRLTPDEVRYVLTNSCASALVCDDADLSTIGRTLEDLALKLRVSIEASGPGWARFDELLESDAVPRYARGETSLIVYTSGTTGAPKGVVSGQRSPHFTPQQVAEYQADVRQSRRSAATGGTSLITMPMHHGSGPAQVNGARSAGSMMVLMRRFDPERALQFIERHRVTDWNAVPTMLKRVASLGREALAQYDVSSLRLLSVGAAPVPYELKEWTLGHFGEHTLTEGYGSTETSMVTRLAAALQRVKPGSSGVPFKHVSIEIRDGDGCVLPAGATGEIWVRTPVTIRQYLNEPPLGTDVLDARGFFRVGDVGHLDEDGFLFITDRTKDMIISGGVNIYPAEIEKVLLQHPDVLDAAVIGVPDEEFGEQVRAFCELKPGRSLAPEEVAAFVAPRLASYKRPKHVQFVAELPRNAMGKILKRELRAPFWKERERRV